MIRLVSVYHINKKRLSKKYQLILKSLFKYYFNDISLSYIKMFNSKIDFSILGVNFQEKGICLTGNTAIIDWQDLGTKNYIEYYLLFSKANQKSYKTFYYLSDWNTGILYSVTRSILKSKKLL